MRYQKSICKTIKSKKKSVFLIVLACTLFFGVVGGLKAKKDLTNEEQKRAELDQYFSQIDSYNKAIADTEDSIKLLDDQYNALKEYVDNSVFMKLDSKGIWVGTAQYSVETLGDKSPATIISALNLYLTKGGILADITEDRNTVKYWSELISTESSGQTIYISIMQPTENDAAKAISAIKTSLLAEAEKLSETEGGFHLIEQNTSVFCKSESEIINQQNVNLTNLRFYETNRSDLETKLFNQKNTLIAYEQSNRPDSLELVQHSGKKTVFLFLILGMIVGIWIALGVVLIDYIAGNRLKSSKDAARIGLEVLGTHSTSKGFFPELAQTVIGIKKLIKNRNCDDCSSTSRLKSIVLYDVSRNEETQQVSEEYTKAFGAANCSAKYIDSKDGGAEALSNLINSDATVIIACVGDAKIHEIEETLRKFQYYQTCCLGVIILE